MNFAKAMGAPLRSRLENLEILEIPEYLQTVEKSRIRPLSRDSKEFGYFGGSRDSSSKKIPFVITPLSGQGNSEPRPLAVRTISIRNCRFLAHNLPHRWLCRQDRGPPPSLFDKRFISKAPDTFNFLRHVMRAILSVRPKCSHRCVSLKETPLKPVQIFKHTTKNSAEQTAMRTKWRLNMSRFKLFRCFSYMTMQTPPVTLKMKDQYIQDHPHPQ